MAIKLIITDLGIAEVINAEQSGTAPTKITQVGFGTGVYTPDPAQTSLQDEFKRLSTIAGGAFGPNQIHVTVSDGPTPDDYSVHEIGLYLESGTLFAVYSQTSPIIVKAAESSAALAIDIELTGEVTPDLIEFGDTNFEMNSATEEREGLVMLAKVPEAILGQNQNKAVTPEGLGAALDAALAGIDFDGLAKAGEIESLEDPPGDPGVFFVRNEDEGGEPLLVIMFPTHSAVFSDVNAEVVGRLVLTHDGPASSRRIHYSYNVRIQESGGGWGDWMGWQERALFPDETAIQQMIDSHVSTQVTRATQPQAEEGDDNTAVMTSLRTKQAIDSQRPKYIKDMGSTATNNGWWVEYVDGSYEEVGWRTLGVEGVGSAEMFTQIKLHKPLEQYKRSYLVTPRLNPHCRVVKEIKAVGTTHVDITFSGPLSGDGNQMINIDYRIKGNVV